jgi:hypothetical protein
MQKSLHSNEAMVSEHVDDQRIVLGPLNGKIGEDEWDWGQSGQHRVVNCQAGVLSHAGWFEDKSVWIAGSQVVRL